MYTGAFYADQRHGFGTFQTPDISEFRVKFFSVDLEVEVNRL